MQQELELCLCHTEPLQNGYIPVVLVYYGCLPVPTPRVNHYLCVHLTDVNGTTPTLIHTPHLAPVPTSASASAVKGVSSEGLSIAVQPAARAAPALRVAMARGKFHCT